MALILYVDVVNKKLLRTANGPVIDSLPPLYYASETPVQIYPRQQNPEYDRDNPYIAYDWSDHSIALSVGTPDGDDETVPAAVTTTFSDISAGKSGSLNLNTAGIAALLGDKTSVQSYLEIKATPTGDPAEVILQMQVEVRGAVLDGEAIPPASRPDYVTRAESLQLFQKRNGLPGEVLTLTSPSGNYSLILGIRDDRSIQMDIVDN
jgi:hypothetical protein